MTDYPGQHRLDTQSSDYNTQEFLIERLLAKVSTASMVKITKVTNSGEVKAVGTVDVQPLVKMVDGVGTTYGHGQVHSLTYFRYQGGDKAVIMDPKVGDVGFAVFADRDISVVKKTKQESAPGSYRRFDMSDGFFFPKALGDTPTSYIQFQDNGSIAISPDSGTTSLLIEKDKVTITSKTIQFIATNVYLEQDATAPVEGNNLLSQKVFVKAVDPAPPD